MKVNRNAVKHAKALIKQGKVVGDSDWSKDQPSAEAENKFLKSHDWDEYGDWYLAIDTSESEETKGRHKFPYGDFKKVHRDGVIAAKQRAAQNGYDEVEKAADDLLEIIDEVRKEKA